MTRLRLGTRASRLALTQSEWVAQRLRAAPADVTVELVEITTSGDTIRDVPLGPHLGQSFFTKEIEDALLGSRIDVAVHSCKDLATTLPDGLCLGAVPSREDPRDAVVSAGGPLDELPRGARVGTSSARRQGFLHAAYPHLALHDQRGNVPTRLEALERGDYDAVVLAVAGLSRLGLADRITEILAPEIVLPAAAQGALAVQVCEGDGRALGAVRVLEHGPTRAEVTAERACLRRLGAGCQAPVGALARAEGPTLRLDAAIIAPDGIVRAHRSGPTDAASDLGDAVARDLLGTLDVASLRDLAWTGTPPRMSGSA